MAALIPKGLHLRKRPSTVVLLGVDLSDAREEAFARMVCDGLALGLAYSRAGFTSKDQNAASRLFALPRVQERAQAILDARATSGAVTLPQVTDMLKRVFANALSEGEYSAAHNSAFSLARLYGHVTDKASIEVIRRPSRDPDAPSEQALASWVEALPALAGPGPEAPGPVTEARFLRVTDAPASPLGPDDQFPNDFKGPGPERYQPTSEGPGLGAEKPNEINGLDGNGALVPGRTENGAPARPVTGTPDPGAHSTLLGPGPPEQKGAPLPDRQVPGYPAAEDLF